jgi:hypothetical protein
MAQVHDLDAARQTYAGFIRVVKVATPVIMLITAFVVSFWPIDRTDMTDRLKLAVLREVAQGETRVAVTPETVKKFIALGADVAVEAGAGLHASIADADYAASARRWAMGRLSSRVRPSCWACRARSGGSGGRGFGCMGGGRA